MDIRKLCQLDLLELEAVLLHQLDPEDLAVASVAASEEVQEVVGFEEDSVVIGQTSEEAEAELDTKVAAVVSVEEVGMVAVRLMAMLHPQMLLPDPVEGEVSVAATVALLSTEV